MKELSVEQKAKAYDEALEKARKWKEIYCGTCVSEDGTMIQDFNNIFPQLTESEDERMRKHIIQVFKDHFSGEDADKCIAWLEKQNEHANFRDSIQVGDKVTRNEDGVLVNLSQLNRVAKKDEKQGEQRPTEEYNITGIGSKHTKGKLGEMMCNLKPLEETIQKSAWSEEDERIYTSIIYAIEHNYPLNEIQQKFVKSLRPQSRWKPSDEQIVAIDTAINVLGKGTLNGKQLIELQEQLKKLIEE